MAVASLVLGIISLVLAIFPVIGWLGIILGVIGIILGAIGRKNAEKRGIATVGMVLSIVAVGLVFIITVACTACIGIGASMQ